MNREDIIRMAREARGYISELPNGDAWLFDDAALERFAALVAAAERDACAEMCERRKSLYWMEFDKTGSDADRAAAIASEECSDAIRARGESK